MPIEVRDIFDVEIPAVEFIAPNGVPMGFWHDYEDHRTCGPNVRLFRHATDLKKALKDMVRESGDIIGHSDSPLEQARNRAVELLSEIESGLLRQQLHDLEQAKQTIARMKGKI